MERYQISGGFFGMELESDEKSEEAHRGYTICIFFVHTNFDAFDISRLRFENWMNFLYFFSSLK